MKEIDTSIKLLETKILIANLKNFDSWEFSDYKLNKKEADICYKALKRYRDGIILGAFDPNNDYGIDKDREV